VVDASHEEIVIKANKLRANNAQIDLASDPIEAQSNL
jgi:hypothetical protein